MAEGSAAPFRLMNFVSQEQLEEAKRTRGERVDDGTAQRDRPLFEILKENKDKQDADFNERFKHRPPKALDEEETEFLDKLEMTRKEYERKIANEEAQELQRFQAAVAAQSMVVHELKEPLNVPMAKESILPVKKKPAAHPFGITITVKPPAKKAKVDRAVSAEPPAAGKLPDGKLAQTTYLVKTVNGEGHQEKECCDDTVKPGLLVSYSDESDED